MDWLNTHLLIQLLELKYASIITILFQFTILVSFFMGDGSTGKRIDSTKEMDNLTLSISSTSFSRDLLQRFLGNSSNNSTSNRSYDGSKVDDEIELNLGLSLGGRFGIDKSAGNLIRSASIASCLPVVKDDNDAVTMPPPLAYAGLMRTTSLPVETEEEWRKRKEMQTMRRMEAKRRRSEKQRNLKGSGVVSRSGSLSLEERKEIEVHLREKLDREKYLGAVRKLRTTIGSQTDLMMIRGGSDVGVGSSNGGGGQEGSVESKGAGLSSLSDLESKSLQGNLAFIDMMLLDPPVSRAPQASSPYEIVQREQEKVQAAPQDSSLRAHRRGLKIGTNSLGDMPCVFIKGDGPNGRRVDGILYKYGKGEEVRIMCVCHGSFHSPTEFVKHAGGTDVDHPLKHIVIKPSS